MMLERRARSDGTARADRSVRSLRNGRLAAASGLLAALGVVSSCCLLPLVLLSLGVGGAWAGNLSALTAYRPIFAAVAVPLLGYGYYCAYRSKTCSVDEACDKPRPNRVTKVALWIATALFALGLVFDGYIEPLLSGS